MPQTTVKGGPELAIVLDNSPHVPGDIIRGSVVRTAFIADPNASVTITLHGREKAYLHRGSGMNSHVERRRFNLLDTNAETYELFRGILHIPPDGSDPASWPFAMMLPCHASQTVVARDNRGVNTFLPTNQVRKYALTPSCELQTGGYGGSTHAFVEYYLEAKLRLSSQGQCTATKPLNVFARSPVMPVTDFEPKSIPQTMRTVTSQRLLPGMENAKLSLREKMKKLLDDKAVPSFRFRPQVSLPSVLQLRNPAPFPILVDAISIKDKSNECAEIIEPDVHVEDFRLWLRSKTHFETKNSFGHGTTATNKILLAELRYLPSSRYMDSSNPARTKKLVISTKDGSPPLDLGKVLSFTTRPRMMVDGYPTFTSFILKHEHALKWELVLSVAQERIKCEGQVDVTVVGPCKDMSP